jgi:TonB-dependent receptor
MLWLGLAASAVAACPAGAQSPAESPSALEEVVVAGRRPIAEAEATALQVQRESDSLISVVAADSIGRLPDQNIAQATSRLPGVAVQRDQGQARYISLRGAPLNWTTLAFDGINVVSPEGRATRFDNVPSAIASQLIVHKAVTADMTGETIAGMVEVITRSPFDYDGFHVAARAGAGYLDLGGGNEYEGSLVLSNRYAVGDGEMGLLLSGSYYQRDMVTDNFENDWETVPQDTQPGFESRFWAHEVENKFYRLTRANYSGSARLDWRPTQQHQFFAQSIYTAFTDDEQRDNYRFDMDDRQTSTPTTPCSSRPNNGLTVSGGASGYADTCTGNTPFNGTVYGIDIRQRATLRYYEQSIFTNTLGGDHDLDAWQVYWRANYTRSINDRSVELENSYDSPATRTLRPTVTYDLQPQAQNLELFPTVVGTAGNWTSGPRERDIDQFQRALVSARSLDAEDVTDAYTARLDLSRDLDLFGGDTTLKFGVRYDQRDKERNESQLLFNTAQVTAAGLPTSFSALAEADKPFKGNIQVGYDFRYFSESAALDFLEGMKSAGSFSPLVGNYYAVEEKVAAGYVMSTTRYDWGNVVGGLRVEQVKNSSEAYVDVDGSQQLVQVDSDRTLVFPSVHVNIDVAEDTRLRLSLNSGAARPDFDDLRPNFTVNDSEESISGGNPEADPERAYGADAYMEWYLQPQGFMMLGLFYKQVEDVLFEDTRVFGLDVLNTPTTDRSGYDFTTLVNGGSGYIYGAEAAFQQQLAPFTARLGLPTWVGGFGIQTNITYNESQATKPDGSKVSFPGTSQIVYNIGLYYEMFGASVRLNYQWRDDWFSEIGSPDTGGDLYWAADGELDFSARYALNESWEIYFDAANLTDQAGRRYVGDSSRTIEWEQYGSRYLLGFRFTR